MIFRIVFHPIALFEYRESVKWYADKSNNASKNFVSRLDEKLAEIAEAPYLFKATYKHFHEAALKKYPFNIVYYIDEPEKMIVISAIYHHRRNPKHKFKPKQK